MAMNLKNWPPSRFNPSRKGFESDLKVALGMQPNSKLPLDSMPEQVVAGVRVWVNSRELAQARGQFHRVRCCCPECGEDVPAGRLFQHAKVHS